MDEIFVNSIIEWSCEVNEETILERVLWISPNKEEVVVIEIGKEKLRLPYLRGYEEIIRGLKESLAKKYENEPYIEILSPSETFLLKHSLKRDKDWEVIKNIVELEPQIYDPMIRGELIKELLLESKHTKKWFYKKLKQYWAYGKTVNALLPLYVNSGGKGKEKKLKDKKIGRPPKRLQENIEATGVNVKEEDKKVFETAISLFYKNKKEPNLKFAYEEMIKEFYHEGYIIKNGIRSRIMPNVENIPNYRQFLYWFNKNYNGKTKALMKHGDKKYNLKYRPLTSNATSRASGPGAIFEIDATVADVYLVSSLSRHRIIGRPVVYIVKDVFSRMVVGLYVGLEGPSWLGAMMALENATTHKKEYCRMLGIDIQDDEWPSHHLPSVIVADRGEMESENANNLISELGIRVENTPPYRADLKGIVEQHFRTINTRIRQWLPGAVYKDFKERGGKDYRLDGKLTLKAFEKVIVLSILEHNKKLINNYPLSGDMIQNNVTPTPSELWEWGLFHRFGHLKEISKDLIRLVLMPTKQVSISRKGIYFNKRHYTSDYAIKKGWFEDAIMNGSKKIKVSYDPRDINHIYFQTDEGNFTKCELVNKFYNENEGELQPRMEDLLEYYEEKHIKNEKMKSEQRQISADIDSQIKAIILEETKKTIESQLPGQSNLSKTKNIRSNRNSEKSIQRTHEAWSDTLENGKPKNLGEIIDISNFYKERDKNEQDPYYEVLLKLDEEEGE